MKVQAAVVGVTLLAGCTSVKLVQREGCWVRRTEKWPGRVHEEIGPCTPPAPEWVDDRLPRLVQECAARADYRWQTRALAAWNRGEPMPEEPGHADILQQCMNEAARAVTSENDLLKKQLDEVNAERTALRKSADDDRRHLLASQEKLTDYLGEAAKKASPPAVATATASSDGQASTESASSSPVSSTLAPASPPAFPASATGATARPIRQRRAAKNSGAPVCPPAGLTASEHQPAASP